MCFGIYIYILTSFFPSLLYSRCSTIFSRIFPLLLFFVFNCSFANTTPESFLLGIIDTIHNHCHWIFVVERITRYLTLNTDYWKQIYNFIWRMTRVATVVATNNMQHHHANLHAIQSSMVFWSKASIIITKK